MGAVTEFLKGKKTNIQAAAVGIVVALFAAGFIDSEMATMALGFLGAGTVASLGAKIDRSNA
jgi:hypothetical protein